jgi:hypothetical protein
MPRLPRRHHPHVIFTQNRRRLSLSIPFRSLCPVRQNGSARMPVPQQGDVAAAPLSSSCAPRVSAAPAPIDGQKARGPWVGPKHDFLARHEHEPSTMLSGLGRHEHDIGLGWAAISAHSAGPARHENCRHDAAHVPARGPAAHLAQPAQRIKSATQPATPPLPIPTLAASHSIHIAGTRSRSTHGPWGREHLRCSAARASTPVGGHLPRRRPPPPPATTSSSSAAPSFSSTILLSQSTRSTVGDL